MCKECHLLLSMEFASVTRWELGTSLFEVSLLSVKLKNTFLLFKTLYKSIENKLGNEQWCLSRGNILYIKPLQY